MCEDLVTKQNIRVRLLLFRQKYRIRNDTRSIKEGIGHCGILKTSKKACGEVEQKKELFWLSCFMQVWETY